MIICQTPLRVSFFGGGTDWPEFFTRHGGAVLGTTIDKFICHFVTRFNSRLFDYSIRLAYRKVECVRTLDEVEHRPFREILAEFGITRDIEVSLAADLPAFSGLGSSSSFTVGLIHALSAYQGRFISKRDLAIKAIEIERGRLGESVGCQDQVFAAYGGLNVVEFHQIDDIAVHKVVIGRERLHELDESLLLYFTGLARKANELEKGKIGRLAESRELLMEMLRLVERGHSLLTGTRSLSGFGELLDRAWTLKKQLGAEVSNPRIDRIYELAREAGATGGKLLGAGGGGFLLLFVPPERQAQVRGALVDFAEVPFRINGSGSTILHS